MLPDGSSVELFTIASHRIELHVMRYGGIIASLRVPDRAGRFGDVVLGHGTLASYLHNPSYLGAIIGRYANRIARGRFTLDGAVYQLSTNDGANHLHGSIHGFDRQLWAGSSVSRPDGIGVAFSRTSTADEERYPGTLNVRVTYLVSLDGLIRIEYEAATDAVTIVNLTQHTYFNLAGEGSTGILDHLLTIDAERYPPVDATLIPTGEVVDVMGTPFDFRTAARIGARLSLGDPEMSIAGGFDHNYVLRREGDGLAHAATLRDPVSGRVLDIHTTEPGLQFYDGHLLDGRIVGAHGRRLGPYAGLCLETQHLPDSPNQSTGSRQRRRGASRLIDAVVSYDRRVVRGRAARRCQWPSPCTAVVKSA